MPKSETRRIDPSDPRPIWRQIDGLLRREIALGRLSPDETVPSVRDLARELRVNPNTVARAIQSLADGGVVETRRGEGTFVAANPPTPSAREQQRGLMEGAERFASIATILGARRTEAVAALETALDRIGPEEESDE